MTQNQTNIFTSFRRFALRFTVCYLLFYFLLLSDFYISVFPFVDTLHKPFKYISDGFVGFVNRLFIHRSYDADVYTGIGDTSWFYMACLVYLLTAVLVAAIWTFLDRRNHYKTLFIVLHTYARYYLAFLMMVYGLGKLFETQFPDPPPDYLMQPLGNLDSHTLLWAFMGASKSYNYFGGLLEAAAGLLLLFRRTCVLGALLSLAISTQVLFLDIGYDTLVKVLVVHLLLLSLFILSPDIRSLWNFFVARRSAVLVTPPTLALKPAYSWIRYGAKALLIGLVFFGLLRQQAKFRDDYAKPYYGGIDGIYETKEFSLNQRVLPPLTTDSFRWRRMAISKFGYMTVQFMNDSTAQYTLQVDTVGKWLELALWNDTAFHSKLHYSVTGRREYSLTGSFNKDSLSVVAHKKELENLPLLKDKGKIKWVWW